MRRCNGRAALTPRLRQTLDCLRTGLSEKEVALTLGLSKNTVHNYVRALHKRFNASNRVELIARGIGSFPTDFTPKLAFAV